MVETRAKILNAALRLFASYGYDAVGVQTIVEAAAITKPTLYHYFGSKRGLIETLIQEQGAPLLDAVREASAYKGDIRQSVADVMRASFTFAEEHRIFYRMMLAMWFAPPSSEYFASVYDLLYQQHLLIEEMFRQAATDHGNMRGRQQHYAISLKGVIDTYIGMSLQGFIELDNADLQYRIAHQYLHGIFS